MPNFNSREWVQLHCTHITPTPEQIRRYTVIRVAYRNILDAIFAQVPEGMARDKALEHLIQSLDWAYRGIRIDGRSDEG